MLFCAARKRDSLACATSVEERDALGRLGGGLAWMQSLSSFFPLFLFAFVCFPFSRRNSVKLQSPKLPGEVLDQQQQQQHGRRESAKSRNHGNPQLGTKQTLLQHTHARTHNTQMCRRWKMPPATVAAATQKKRNSEHKVSKEKSRVEFSWEPA